VSEIIPRRERFKLYEKGIWAGYFNVDYSASGRKLSIDLFGKSAAFALIADENRHVEGRPLDLWISARIVPPTRIGIDALLLEMGLSEYDKLSILKYTSAEHTNDSCVIDFSSPEKT
jgi:hypothetical protein